MSDWADKLARKLNNDDFGPSYCEEEFAEVFRGIRKDALEEAARIADAESESARMASMDFETDAAFSCEQVAERIRALKDE